MKSNIAFCFANLGTASNVNSFPTLLPELPPSNTLTANPSEVWRSADTQDHALAYEWANPQTIDFFAFDVRKCTGDAVFYVDMFDALNPGSENGIYSSGPMPKDGDYCHRWLDTPVTGVYVLNFVIIDPNQGRGYHEVERTYAGLRWSPKFNCAWEPTLTYVDNAETFRGETGVSTVTPGVRYRNMFLRFPSLNQADMQTLHVLLNSIGKTGDFAASLYPESANAQQINAHFGIWRMVNDFQITHRIPGYWSMGMELTESRGDNPLADYLNKIAALEQTIINLTGA